MTNYGNDSSLQLGEVMPALTVNDLETSIAFYRDVLGFELVDTFEDDGKMLGASVQAGYVVFMLAQDDGAKGTERQKGVGLRLFLTTEQDIDELAASVKKRGGTLDREPKDQPWGSRDFTITDPNGFLFSISTPPAELEE